MIKREFKCLILGLVTLDLLRRSVFGSDSLILKSDCVCPGYPSIYECTVFGESGGITVWQGSAFNCTSREISLHHGDYESSEGARGECGGIVGRSVRIVDENNSPAMAYISQLSVSIRSNIIGRTIECLYDDGTTSMSALISTLTATTAPFPPPERMYLSDADLKSRVLTFKWSPVAPDCPAIHYNILASNCGSCPAATNHTTVTCTDVPTNGNSCTFALQTVVCGHIVGNTSEMIKGTIQGCNGCTGAIVSATLLAVILSVCVAVFTTTILYLIKDKINILKGTINIRSQSRHTERTLDYEDVKHNNKGGTKSAIDTRKNVAYGRGLSTPIVAAK